MSNCWKIGSRWSVDGSESSRIITIFRRSNVVFVGGDAAKRFHDQVKKGDYFAIADGIYVVAVARAVSDVKHLPEMIREGLIKVRDGEPFDLSKNFDGCYGVEVKIVGLPKQDQFEYLKRGTFFSANKYSNRIKELYDTKVNNTFDITANVLSEDEPNLFSFATSELSQDAMFAWLIKWSDPKYNKLDSNLNSVAQKFVRLLMNKDKDSSFKIYSVNVGRQLQNIDVWAEINNNSFLVIEDKTGTSIHSNQLDRYKQFAKNRNDCKRNDLYFAYVKTGNEPESKLKEIKESGYEAFGRKDILSCLNKYSGTNQILLSYRDYLQKIEEDTMSYKTLPYKKWSCNAWQGFYKELEEKKNKKKGLNITSWGYVPNPTGGFWGIWWHYIDIKIKDDEKKVGEMYLQIEQGKLCFKIRYYGDRKNRYAFREKYHSKLMKVKGDQYPEIVKPARFGAGTFMTIAIVEPSDLFGDGVVDIDKVVERLKKYQGLIDQCCQ